MYFGLEVVAEVDFAEDAEEVDGLCGDVVEVEAVADDVEGWK